MLFTNRYRPNKWPFYILVVWECPFTVALLALFGIASPDLYRTRLWQVGSNLGYNSNPNEALYAAANYRPYTTPAVWSQFITDYNVVISVLSMFILLCKAVMYIVHVWPPLLSAVVHAILVVLYAVSIRYQAGSDMSDPQHPQHGAPWYITKSCSVVPANDQTDRGYCKQAKGAFACTCIMLGIFLFQLILAIYSCFPSEEYRRELNEERAAKRLRFADQEADTDDYQWPKTAFDMRTPVPNTPGTTGGMKSPNPNRVPMTPRTQAFNRLGGTKDLPLRNHFSSPNTPKSAKFSLGSPDLSRSPLSAGFDRAQARAEEVEAESSSNPAMYFPPPPKIASNK